jgi:hypothetical protein
MTKLILNYSSNDFRLPEQTLRTQTHLLRLVAYIKSVTPNFKSSWSIFLICTVQTSTHHEDSHYVVKLPNCHSACKILLRIQPKHLLSSSMTHFSDVGSWLPHNTIVQNIGAQKYEGFISSGLPRNFFRGGVQQIQLRTENRERGSGGGSPLVRGSGGSCNLVREISFHIVNFS